MIYSNMSHFPPCHVEVFEVKKTKRSALVIYLEDALTASSEPVVLKYLDQHRRTKATHILVDLSRVPYVDTQGVGLLVVMSSTFRDLEKHFALVKPNGPVLQVFRQLKLGTSIPIFPEYPEELHWY